jgi:lipid-binding SYLF domain-containing protein
MNLKNLFIAGSVVLSFAAGGAFAQDAAKKQAEIRKVTSASMEKFYTAKPELKGEVGKAPGYAVFTTYGLSFIVGGAGGKGLAHDNASKADTYMHMAQASAGVQAGVAQSEVLIVFTTKQALDDFITKGWDAGGGGALQAGAGGKSAGPAAGASSVSGAQIYTLTKNGVQVGVALAGTKFWKDKDLN